MLLNFIAMKLKFPGLNLAAGHSVYFSSYNMHRMDINTSDTIHVYGVTVH